jgi:hypothetical protein
MKTQNSFATTTCPNTLAGRFRTACATRLLPLLLLLALPGVVQAAQFGDFLTRPMAPTPPSRDTPVPAAR